MVCTNAQTLLSLAAIIAVNMESLLFLLNLGSAKTAMLRANNPNGQYDSFAQMLFENDMFSHVGLHDLRGIPAQEMRDLQNTGLLYPMKFVEVDINHALNISAMMKSWLSRTWREWIEFGDTGIVGTVEFRSDDIYSFIALFKNVQEAAIGACNLFKPKWDRLAADVHADRWIVELGNEHGITDEIADFYLEVAREIKRRYGEKLLLGMFSKNSGGYNEPELWKRIVNRVLIPAFRECLRVVVALHAYSSGWSEVGNTKHYQHGDVTKLTKLLDIALPGFALDMVDVGDPQKDRQQWTGFAPGWVASYVYQLMRQVFYGEVTDENPDGLTYEAHDFELDIGEAHADRMGEWADGTTGGGMWEWAANGAYDFNLTGITLDDLLAESLWRYLQYYRQLALAGITIHGIYPFTYNDGSGHWTSFLHKVIMNPFIQRVRQYKPVPPNDNGIDLDAYSYCVITPMTVTPVRYRSEPDWRDATTIEGTISPGRAYRVWAYTTNQYGERWWHTEVEQGIRRWVCGTALDPNDGKFYPITRHAKKCDTIPQWQTPQAPDFWELLKTVLNQIRSFFRRLIYGNTD